MLQESPRDKKTILMCHANAGNMGHRVPIAVRFYRYGWNVFMFSYRGLVLHLGEVDVGMESRLDRRRSGD